MHDDTNAVIWIIRKKKEGFFSNKLPYTGRYGICFEANTFSFISFDFELSSTVS